MKMRMVAASMMTAALAVAGPAAAQNRPENRADLLTLRGAGSTIGLTVRDMSADETAKAKNQLAGVVVEQVRDSSPAATAGVRVGDIVLQFDGERVRSVRQFTRLVTETPPQRTVKMEVVRDGSRRTVDITPEVGRVTRLDDFGAAFERRLQNVPPLDFNLNLPQLRIFAPQSGRLGVMLTPLSSQLGDYFGVKQGALVNEVVAESAAAKAGLKAGDVITDVNGQPVADPASVVEAIGRTTPGAMVDLKIVRDRKELQLKATMPERRRERVVDGRLPI